MTEPDPVQEPIRREGARGRRPTRHPVADETRARLREAQKRETAALRDVTAAEKARARAQVTLDHADRSLAAAQSGLVKVSGAERAALLLDLPVAVLRSRIRHAEAAHPAQGPSADRG